MKRIVSIILLSMHLCLFSKYHNRNNNDDDGTNYVLNLTGKNIRLNFYAKMFGGKTWVGVELVDPLLFFGKTPSDFLSTITAKMLPEKIDMHISSSSYITVSVVDLKGKNGINHNIKGCKFPTPSMGNILKHDYKITLEGKQLVVTKLNTFSGIPIPKKRQNNLQQWPSKFQMAMLNMAPPEKIIALKDQNTSLEKGIKNLEKEIKGMRFSDGSIKPGKTAQLNNRKKMRDDKKELIKSNNKKIAKLQKEIASSTSDTPVVLNPEEAEISNDSEDETVDEDEPENSVENLVPATPATAATA